MKTIKELQEELADIKYKIQNEEMKPAVEKRLRKRIPFLKLCVSYLESNPDKAYLKKEVDGIEAKIDSLMSRFPIEKYEKQEPPLTKPEISKLRKIHEKEYQIPHMRTQVRTLRFLLKS